MKKSIWTVLIFLSIVTGAFAQRGAHKWLRQGDKAYTNNQYPQAEEEYLKAQIKNNSTKGAFNLGNTIYQQERYQEAIEHYEAAAQAAKSPAVKGMAYHNLGNAYFQAQELEKSIEAYKNALRQRPNDQETKVNLALAKKQLQMQQQQQQQQQQNNENEDNQEQQEQQQQQQQDQEQQEQQQQAQNEQNEQEEQKEQQASEDLSKEEAEALLKIMEEEEKKVQEKVRKAKGKPSKSKKEW